MALLNSIIMRAWRNLLCINFCWLRLCTESHYARKSVLTVTVKRSWKVRNSLTNQTLHFPLFKGTYPIVTYIVMSESRMSLRHSRALTQIIHRFSTWRKQVVIHILKDIFKQLNILILSHKNVWGMIWMLFSCSVFHPHSNFPGQSVTGDEKESSFTNKYSREGETYNLSVIWMRWAESVPYHWDMKYCAGSADRSMQICRAAAALMWGIPQQEVSPKIFPALYSGKEEGRKFKKKQKM